MKISKKELNSLLKNKEKVKKNINNKNKIETKKRTYYDRLNDAIKFGFNFREDKITINNKSAILHFNNVYLLSHNDILRINFKMMYKYIKLWKERVAHLVNKVSLEEWQETKSKKIKIEFLYTTKNSQCLDYDSTVGAVKFIIDGLTESSVIFDDSIEFIPVVLSRQKRTEGNNSLTVVLTPITEEEYETYFSNEFKNIL